jgi:hypothetical protein
MTSLRLILFSVSVIIRSLSFGQCSACDSAYQDLKTDVAYVRFLNHGRFTWDKDVQILYDRCMQRCNLIALLPHLHDSLAIMRTIVYDGIAQKTENIEFLEAIFKMHRSDSAFVDDTSQEHFSETVPERMHRTLSIKKINPTAPTIKHHMDRSYTNDFRSPLPLWHGGIRLKDLLALDSLTAPHPDWKIISFMLTSSTRYALREYNVGGNRISTEMKKHFGELQSGNKIFIENIKVIIPDGTTRKLAPLTLFIH